MIPYDDLVAALSAWRARQGLPVSTMGGAAPQTTATATTGGSGPMAAVPGSGPHTAPPRTAPPRPAPARGAAPPPLEPADDLDVEDAALLEEAHYETDDFSMSFGNDGETAVGSPPAPPPPAKGKSKRNNDW